MESRIISPLNERNKKESYTVFLKNLVALEKCEKLIIDIENLMQRNHLMRDEDNETIENINKLLVDFGMLQWENGLNSEINMDINKLSNDYIKQTSKNKPNLKNRL